MNNITSISEEDFYHQSTLTNLSTNSLLSIQNQPSTKQTEKKILSNLFQTSKQQQRFFTMENKNQINESNNPQIKIQKELNITQNQFKTNYLDLLVSSLDSQFEKGEITLNYLNSKSIKFDFDINSFKTNNYSKKCENKICSIIVDDPSKIFPSKFYSSNSYKSQILNLCEKCYIAFKKGNYCYYCNVIYRDFDFNTSYYDKKKWIQCDYCLRWEHMQCEENKGKLFNIEQLALNPNFMYMCPFCRKENDKIIKGNCKKKEKKCLNKKRNYEKSNNNSTCDDL